jgi:hypothetical protein
MTRRKKWDPERMNAAMEAARNKEMGSYKAFRVLTYNKQHYGVISKTRKAQVKQ